MAYTLFDITYRVAQHLEYLLESVATGGSATTIIDTLNLQTVFANDYFNRGAAWITYDAGGAGASPQGKFARVTDFDKAEGKVTMESVTDAVAAGDRYALASGRYPLDVIISKVNQALDDTPAIVVDTTTITTDDEKTEYTLPLAILDERIAVSIQSNVVTNDNRWIPWHDWYIQQTTTGTAKKLVMRSQPPAPYALKIEYEIPHPPLNVNTDKLQERISIVRLAAEAAYLCLIWKKSQPGDTDPNLDKRIAEMAGRLERARGRYPLDRVSRPKLATYGVSEGDWVE